jgi:hypothetical protein
LFDRGIFEFDEEVFVVVHHALELEADVFIDEGEGELIDASVLDRYVVLPSTARSLSTACCRAYRFAHLSVLD